jgi:hypothetical protein
MKDNTPSVFRAVCNQDESDYFKMVPLSVHEKYFEGNSEAYGKLQDGKSISEDSIISYFIGDA